MTLHIVAMVCLLYQVDTCKEITLTFAEAPNPMFACMSPIPMVELSKWSESNPNWWVKRWTCTSIKSENI